MLTSGQSVASSIVWQTRGDVASCLVWWAEFGPPLQGWSPEMLWFRPTGWHTSATAAEGGWLLEKTRGLHSSRLREVCVEKHRRHVLTSFPCLRSSDRSDACFGSWERGECWNWDPKFIGYQLSIPMAYASICRQMLAAKLGLGNWGPRHVILKRPLLG